MRKIQLPVHYKSAQETRRVRPSVDSGDAGVHIEISSVSNLGSRLADGTDLAFSLSFFNGEAPPNVTLMREAKRPTHCFAAGSASAASAVGIVTWLLSSAVICVTTVYTICNPKWLPSFAAQTVTMSKQLSAEIKRRASTAAGGTAVTDTAKAGPRTVAAATGAHDVPTGCNSASAFQPKGETAHGSSSGVHPTLGSDRDETGTPDFMNHDFNQGVTPPATAMPKVAEAKTLKSTKGFLVPPPPAAPCLLPPAFDFFLLQPAQQDSARQQQLQQAPASRGTHNQSADRDNTLEQSTAASGGTEPSQSAAPVVADQKLQAADQELQKADQELQAALRSSLRTVGEWTR
jgi:hypothetical protein